MKNKKEQIRKVADALSYECQQSKTCDGCFARGRVCSDYKTAEKLYKAGYRKASDVIDEFVGRLKAKESPKLLTWEYGEGYSDCIKIAEQIADEMRQAVEK